jgi:hypothetical protein
MKYIIYFVSYGMFFKVVYIEEGISENNQV